VRPDRTVTAVLAVGLSLALAACGGMKSSASDDAMRVAFLVESSGAGASMGSQAEAGVKLAVEEINETEFLGSGKDIHVDIVDTGGDPARALAAANRAVKDDRTVGVLCCLFTNLVAAITPVMEKAGVPLVTTGAIGEDLTKSDVVVRGAPLIQPATAQLVAATVNAFAPKTAVVVYTQDNEGMAADKDVAVGAFKDAGVDVSTVGTATADTNYSGPATQVLNKNADLILVDLLGNSNAAMIKELRDRGYNGTIMANTVVAAQEQWDAAGDALVGTLMPVAFNPTGESESVKNFVARWEEKYPERAVDQIAANGYSSTWLIARAIKEAGGDVSSASVLKSLGELDVVETPTGELKYGGNNGEPERVDKFDFVQWDAKGEIVGWDGSAENHITKD
jgi:branched-chain amino acid transport system substrate-binding protein